MIQPFLLTSRHNPSRGTVWRERCLRARVCRLHISSGTVTDVNARRREAKLSCSVTGVVHLSLYRYWLISLPAFFFLVEFFSRANREQSHTPPREPRLRRPDRKETRHACLPPSGSSAPAGSLPGSPPGRTSLPALWGLFTCPGCQPRVAQTCGKYLLPFSMYGIFSINRSP